LIVAVLLSFILLSLPSVVITMLFGSLLLGISLLLNPAILIVLPLCAMPLAGVGALIGTYARTPEEAGSISLFLTLSMLGPVIIPPDHLPSLLLFLGHMSPATYAASALRQTLIGPMTGEIVIDLTVLVGFTLVTFWLAGRKMDWRQR
jgi:ABC-2 type transport system permease protein